MSIYGVGFFRYTDWILCSGNYSLLQMPPDALRNRCVCHEHFDINSFYDIDNKKLKANAIPKMYNSQEPFPDPLDFVESELLEEQLETSNASMITIL